MPSSRKKGKKKISFWLTEAEISEMKEFADILEVNATDAMRTMIIMAKKEGEKILKKKGTTK